MHQEPIFQQYRELLNAVQISKVNLDNGHVFSLLGSIFL